jgi:hypothetical protein
MAAGDFTLFQQFYADEANEVHDLDTDNFKLALITSTVTPSATDATPRFGAGSGVDYDANEVDSTSASYPTGGVTLSSVTFSATSGVYSFDSADISITQDATDGFTNARWAILYNDSATNKEALGFLDLGSNLSLQAGNINITPPANGWFRKGAGTIS